MVAVSGEQTGDRVGVGRSVRVGGPDSPAGTDPRPGSATDDADSPEDGSDAVDRRPGRTSVAFAIAAAAVATPLLGLRIAVPVHLLGPSMLVAGAVLGRRHLLDYGAVVTMATIALGGTVVTPPPERIVLAAVVTIVAWDVGQYGITIGDQLGRGAATARIEFVHAALTATVGLAAAAVGYAAYLLIDAEGSALAVALLLAGILALATALR